MSDISKRALMMFEESGMSYSELGKATGIPKSALQRYLVGETDKIPIDRLEAIARALGTTAAYLLGWDSEPAVSVILTDEEKTLMDGFRLLPEQGKQYMLHTLSMAMNMYRNNPNATETDSYASVRAAIRDAEQEDGRSRTL